MSAKMDGVHTRTPQQLEQKLNFGKSFAEVMGIATDARDAAEEAKKATENLDDNLTSEEIYNRLTNNGQLQGLYRDDDGNLYVNAEYIYALEELFAKDITMSGTFTHKAMVFLEPTKKEVETIQKHMIGTEFITPDRIALYDFNEDGAISSVDLARCQKAILGVDSLANWSGAVETEATITINMADPNKIIHITGTNMWGSEVDRYIGVNFTNIKNPDTESRLSDIEVALEQNYQRTLWSGAHYMNSGQTATLAELVSVQPNGIVLEFCGYDADNKVVYDNGIFNCFIPKASISAYEGRSRNFTLIGELGVAFKSLQIYDDRIVGCEANGAEQWNVGNIVCNNKCYVLRTVYGV